MAEEGADGITIGEALDAAALAAGRKPMDWSDAAAVQAAEGTTTAPGGVGAVELSHIGCGRGW